MKKIIVFGEHSIVKSFVKNYVPNVSDIILNDGGETFPEVEKGTHLYIGYIGASYFVGHALERSVDAKSAIRQWVEYANKLLEQQRANRRGYRLLDVTVGLSDPQALDALFSDFDVANPFKFDSAIDLSFISLGHYLVGSSESAMAVNELLNASSLPIPKLSVESSVEATAKKLLSNDKAAALQGMLDKQFVKFKTLENELLGVEEALRVSRAEC